jgi:hypothetical protein
MRAKALVGVAAAALVVAGIGLPAVEAAEQKAKQDQSAKQDKPDQEQWRFTFHNGEWWYWLPTNRWVYWRNNRWNDYDPQTFVFNPATNAMPAGRVETRYYSGQTAPNEDIRPFYGHSQSELDRRPLEPNGEVGPFYGHALPNEVFGPWRARRAIRPYYGHAISEGD